MAMNFKYDESEVEVYTPATSSCTGTRKMGWEVTSQLNPQKDSEALVSSLCPLPPNWSPLGQVQARLPTRRTSCPRAEQHGHLRALSPSLIAFPGFSLPLSLCLQQVLPWVITSISKMKSPVSVTLQPTPPECRTPILLLSGCLHLHGWRLNPTVSGPSLRLWDSKHVSYTPRSRTP